MKPPHPITVRVTLETVLTDFCWSSELDKHTTLADIVKRAAAADVEDILDFDTLKVIKVEEVPEP